MLYVIAIETLRQDELSTALRQLARAFDALADALAPETEPGAVRTLAALREWGERGLTRAETSALLRKHGFPPQTAGGWARGEWIETRSDGLRYATERSLDWLAEEADEDG